MYIYTEPQNRLQIRKIAYEIRSRMEAQDTLFFPIMILLEIKMPIWDEDFSFEIVPKASLSSGTHAEIFIDKKIITIREDVYLGAYNNTGRDRMTIAHEIGHYILQIEKGLQLFRDFSSQKPEPYRDPEWQTKAFAGELLCPSHLIQGMQADQIAENCGVSREAACYIASKQRKQGGQY